MGPRQKYSQATCSTSCKHETPLHGQKKQENKGNESEPTKPLTFVTFDPDDATSFLDLVCEDALAVLGRKIDEVMADTRNQVSLSLSSLLIDRRELLIRRVIKAVKSSQVDTRRRFGLHLRSTRPYVREELERR